MDVSEVQRTGTAAFVLILLTSWADNSWATIRARLGAALGTGQLFRLAIVIASVGMYEALTVGIFKESEDPRIVLALFLLRLPVFVISAAAIDSAS
jgi:hypothetical protein